MPLTCEPTTPPLPGMTDDDTAQGGAYARFLRRAAAGELDAYAGGYVAGDGDVILSHGPDLSAVAAAAEQKAGEAGVPPARLAYYFVPPPE